MVYYRSLVDSGFARETLHQAGLSEASNLGQEATATPRPTPETVAPSSAPDTATPSPPATQNEAGVGLELRNVTPSRSVNNDVPVLIIDGEVLNISTVERAVPLLRVTLRDDREHDVQSWTVAAGTVELAPNAAAPFHTVIARPPEAATGVVVSFTDISTPRSAPPDTSDLNGTPQPPTQSDVSSQASIGSSEQPQPPLQASFDCALARRADEKIICSDGSLAETDREMGLLYRQYRDASTTQDQPGVVQDQTHWIDTRNVRCGINAATQVDQSNRANLTECMDNQETNRVAELKSKLLVVQARKPSPAAPVAGGQPQFWYYCDAAKAYFPYVSSCSGGWREVPAGSR